MNPLALVSLLVLPLARPLQDQAPAAPAGPVVSVPSFPNTTCPIMGKPISSRLWVDTPKGRFWVCCKGCNVEILADVDTAHRAAYPVVKKLALERCPRTGEPLPPEAPTLVLQGFEIPLCCAPCRDDLVRDSQVVLARLQDPELVDLGNPLCPISGEAVRPNAFCVIDGSVVRLSDERRVEDARKAPAETLARARAIVAEHGAIPLPACPEKAQAERAREAGEASRAPVR